MIYRTTLAAASERKDRGVERVGVVLASVGPN